MLIEHLDSLDIFFLRLRAQDHCDVIYKRDQVEGSSQERQERLQLGKERLQLGKVSAILGKVKDPFLPFLSQERSSLQLGKVSAIWERFER